MWSTGGAPGAAVSILQPSQARDAAPSHCTAGKAAGYALSNVATPATATHISSWSPAITPSVAARPARTPPLVVEVIKARFPGPGMARNNTMAATKAPESAIPNMGSFLPAGRRGNGAMGQWGNGAMGQWGNGAMGGAGGGASP